MHHILTPEPLTIEQKRFLASKIGALLMPNVSSLRGVYDMENRKLPDGTTFSQRINKLLKFPLDGLRGEPGGTTLTIELTNQRQGLQDDPDAIRYATADYDEFRTWLYNFLRRNGLRPDPPVALLADHSTTVRQVCITPNLSKPTYVNHPKRKRSR